MKKERITIEKLFGGIINRYLSLSFADEGKNDEYSSTGGSANFIRPERVGHLAPGFSLSNVADPLGYINGLPLNGVVSSAGYAFILLKTNRIIKIDLTLNPYSVSDKYDISLVGDATHNGHTLAQNGYGDIEILEIGGVEYVVASYEDNLHADIMIVGTDLSEETGLDIDWFSTSSGGAVLTKGVPLKFLVGNDGNLYCTNKNYLAYYDPTLNASEDQAAPAGNNFIITSLDNYGEYVAFVGYKKNYYSGGLTRGASKMWLFDNSSGYYNEVYDIGDNYVSAIFNDGGEIYVFTKGTNNTGKIKKFNGTGFDTVKELYGMAPPAHGGIDKFLNHIVFDSAGVLMAYGTPDKIQYRKGLHKIGSSGSGGMVKNLYQNDLYVGYSATTLSYLNLNGYAVNDYWRSRLYVLPLKSVITQFRIYFSQFGSGASISVHLFKEYNTTSLGGGTDLLNETIANSSKGAITFWNLEKTIDEVNAFYLVILFNHSTETDIAAIIRKIEIDYQYDEVV